MRFFFWLNYYFLLCLLLLLTFTTFVINFQRVGIGLTFKRFSLLILLWGTNNLSINTPIGYFREIKYTFEPVLKISKHLILHLCKFLRANISNNIVISFNNIIRSFHPIFIPFYLIQISSQIIRISYPSVIGSFDLIAYSTPSITFAVILKNYLAVYQEKKNSQEKNFHLIEQQQKMNSYKKFRGIEIQNRYIFLAVGQNLSNNQQIDNFILNL